MILKCKRCGRVWDYKGKSNWYTNCPTCRTTVRVREYKGEENKEEAH